MTSRFVSVLDEMREAWDRRAREDALGAAAPACAGGPEADFWASGEQLVAARVEPEVPALRAAAGDRPLRALEIGCGIGRLLRPMVRWFDEVHGVDVSDEMLRRAEGALQGEERVHLHRSDGMTLQCVRRFAFDLVLSYDTLGHLPEQALLVYVLRQARHRLAPNGLLLFQLPAAAFEDAVVAHVVERAGLERQKSECSDKDLWIWARRD